MRICNFLQGYDCLQMLYIIANDLFSIVVLPIDMRFLKLLISSSAFLEPIFMLYIPHSVALMLTVLNL